MIEIAVPYIPPNYYAPRFTVGLPPHPDLVAGAFVRLRSPDGGEVVGQITTVWEIPGLWPEIGCYNFLTDPTYVIPTSKERKKEIRNFEIDFTAR